MKKVNVYLGVGGDTLQNLAFNAAIFYEIQKVAEMLKIAF